MTIALQGVLFNHSSLTRANYCLPLRLNEDLPLALPEWVSGMSKPSFAAYIRNMLPATALVFARFALDRSANASVEVQAIAADLALPGRNQGTSLPNLPPTPISFLNGASGWCAFPLDIASIGRGGVSRSVTQWTWQIRSHQNEPWISFDQSVHTTYLVLSTPTAPWNAVNLPWLEVLDVACEWAAGSQSTSDAASRITEAVYKLGETLLKYDAAVGAPHYTVLGIPRFLCNALLERLRGGPGAGPLVNCSDCATIVSTFANILGADLWQSKMGFVAGEFRLNPILAIGSREWSRVNGAFGFHEVAWSGACTERDSVFDACLKTDADRDPTSAPQSPSLPMNQIFGAVGEPGAYRDQLAAPADRALCAPYPPFRIRRPLAGTIVPTGPVLLGEALRAVSLRVAKLDMEEPLDRTNYFFVQFRLAGDEFAEWALAGLKEFLTPQPPPFISASKLPGAQVAFESKVTLSWWRSSKKPEAIIRVDIYDTPSVADARKAFLRIVADLELPLLEPWDSDQIGDLALRAANRALVILVRGNLVHVIRSAGTELVDVTTQAQRLDKVLTRAGTIASTTTIVRSACFPQRVSSHAAWFRIVSNRVRVRRERCDLVVEPCSEEAGIISVFAAIPGNLVTLVTS